MAYLDYIRKIAEFIMIFLIFIDKKSGFRYSTYIINLPKEFKKKKISKSKIDEDRYIKGAAASENWKLEKQPEPEIKGFWKKLWFFFFPKKSKWKIIGKF